MREFLETIKHHVITKEVSWKDTVTEEIIKHKEEPIIFENVEGHTTRIAAGIVSTRELLAKSIGVTPGELADTVGAAFNNPLPLRKVETAPFLHTHIENPDIANYIPIPEFFGGKRYLTASIVLALDPDTGRRNASIHRMMYLGKNRFAIRPVPQRHLHSFYTTALERGADHLDIVVLLGVHPAFELGAATSYPGLDEMAFASYLMGGAEEYILNGIGVPKETEIVMVGKMLREEVEEGPFVDLTGTQDHVRMQPLVEITDLYMRENPIFRTILPGMKEHKILMGIPQEPRMKKLIKNTVPTVTNVVMTEGGGSWLHAVVQIKKRTDGDGKNAIIAALAAHPSLKRVVVVDEDIDPTDPVDVEWAIATRFQPDKDMVLVPGAKGSSLDPSATNSITCKWGLDATKPLGATGFDRVI
ncbi:MAG: UbiD family decarboxylase [Methanobacteriota archaeon]|nr:MAG: UbiD family decarboxylase [Euryarchaeota archaeon]